LKDKLIKLYADYSKNKYEILKLSNELFGKDIYNRHYNVNLQKILTYAEDVRLNNENLKKQIKNISGVADKRISEIKTWTFEDVRTYVTIKNEQYELIKSKQNGRINEH